MSMQQRANVAIDDDDDDSDVEQEAAETVEKFVQTRHVQTLKYLQRVIDENRQLRLHVEHLKENQSDSAVPTAFVHRPKVNSDLCLSPCASLVISRRPFNASM